MSLFLVLLLQVISPNVNPALVVSSCGNLSLTAGQRVYISVLANGNLCISGTVTATVDTSTLATSAKQDTGNSSLSTIAAKDFSTAANQTTGNTSLSSIKTDTDTFVTSGGGGYVRQDSTATMAKESGGNLATIAAKDFATTAKQDTGNTSLASVVTNTNLPATATVTTVAVVQGSTILLASNTSRKGATIQNDSNSPLLIKFGGTTDYNDYTLRIEPHQTQALPMPIYTGALYGLWVPPIASSLITQARITETQ